MSKVINSAAFCEEHQEIRSPKCLVYLALPWIDNTSFKFEQRIKIAVNSYHRASGLPLIFSTKSILSAVYENASILAVHPNDYRRESTNMNSNQSDLI